MPPENDVPSEHASQTPDSPSEQTPRTPGIPSEQTPQAPEMALTDGVAAMTPAGWPPQDHAPGGQSAPAPAVSTPLSPNGAPAVPTDASVLLTRESSAVDGDGESSPPPPPASRIARFRAWRFAPIVEVLGTIAIALLLAESVQAAVVKPFVIPSQSMEPTLMPGQRVLVNRLAYDFGSTPARGDIVVFHPPDSLVCKVNVPVTEPCPVSNTKPSSQYFVKRVIGLPGDHLWIENGHPVINGKELTHEPYITPCSDSTSCNMPHVITIPRGEYYMLGDNRGDSDDSRYWGPVPESWIIGAVFATYWPPDRIGIF
ncbi:MAG TPA: signal peptidase I [Solirubrobacteraceae bacterium]|jgi:signal peptidase I